MPERLLVKCRFKGKEGRINFYMAIIMPLGFSPLTKAAEMEHTLVGQSLGFTSWDSFLFKYDIYHQKKQSVRRFQHPRQLPFVS